MPELAILARRFKNRSAQGYRRAASGVCQLVDATVGQIETAQCPSRPGIRFLQNGCVRCAHLGLCLGNKSLVGSKLIR
jgi:hypothetical protein